MPISHGFVPSHQIRAFFNRVKIASIQLLHVCRFQKSFVEEAVLKLKPRKCGKSRYIASYMYLNTDK